MRNTKKYFILIGILLLVIVMYFLCPKSDSFDNLIFKGINKNSINRIRIVELRSDYDKDKKIEDSNSIQDILSQLGEVSIIQSIKDVPKGHGKVYDCTFSNRSKYISNDEDKPISSITISFYDTGYITVYGQGTLKSKNYRIINDSDIKDINELFSQL